MAYGTFVYTTRKLVLPNNGKLYEQADEPTAISKYDVWLNTTTNIAYQLPVTLYSTKQAAPANISTFDFVYGGAPASNTMWRGTLGGMPASVIWQEVDLDSYYEEQSFTYMKDGVTKGHSFEKWYRCSICGFNYPRSKIIFFRGKPYGVPCRCADDIPDIILKEKLRRANNGRIWQ